jgi:hypothetical protein
MALNSPASNVMMAAARGSAGQQKCEAVLRPAARPNQEK